LTARSRSVRRGTQHRRYSSASAGDPLVVRGASERASATLPHAAIDITAIARPLRPVQRAALRASVHCAAQASPQKRGRFPLLISRLPRSEPSRFLTPPCSIAASGVVFLSTTNLMARPPRDPLRTRRRANDYARAQDLACVYETFGSIAVPNPALTFGARSLSRSCGPNMGATST